LIKQISVKAKWACSLVFCLVVAAALIGSVTGKQAPKAGAQESGMSEAGPPGSYLFRTEIEVTNNSTIASRNVTVVVPLPENDSPYQTTSLKKVNYDIVSSSGRMSTFHIGDLAPGEVKTIVADFEINVSPIPVDLSNEIVAKAREAFDQFAGSGNCRELAHGFIKASGDMGIMAREVVGFARSDIGQPMSSGSLKGTRHSWAEFHVDGYGWVPVDLTFQYFGSFPQASHIIEGYSVDPIKINSSGGSLSAIWSNSIL
jgi:hypothetical protein